ncbi:MAG: ribosomal RNA small subunit methyltransferase A, partial [Clostridia bacterium]|nr:ribosomal RNA small subunit methyltransferase A [Clostridia bacterium]MBN2882151.1 ribosomal RNA small subunit methyltransferase A [Clostridia bacterium]
LVAIEIDRHMIPLLEEVLSDYDNTKIINRDVLETDIEEVISEFPEFTSYKVVANLPYYITTPIIMKFIESSNPPEQMTVMMQKEVADRLRAKPGNKEYGSLTVAIGVFCDISKVMDVSSNCFYPKPDVASTVLNLQNKGKDILKGIDRDLFFSIVRASFAQRRKKMSNSVVNTAGLSLTREQVEKVLENIGVSNDIRAEKLSLEQFILFSAEIESLLRN